MKIPTLNGFGILLCLLAATASGAGAGTATDPGAADGSGRLRVGLVLSGGGARGAAHIGVLRELERLRVPIDAIAGTSMGAIVGGLYASGMSPAELEEAVASFDWLDAFQDTLRRENLVYRRKQDDIEYPVNFEMGLREGRLLLPQGLIYGQKLGLVLRELTADVAHIRDFDDLPTPFRAVASDVATGESFVMGQGDLALAMRASMSAPGIFAPVMVNGRLLVDGGLVGNLPIDAMQSMDVDVIIAVDVQSPLYAIERIVSPVDITSQVLTILIQKETNRQLETLSDEDVLIRPELGDLGSADFTAITDAIAPGANATALQAERLLDLSVTPRAYRDYQAARSAYRGQSFRLDFVRIVDKGPLSARVLRSRLNAEAGKVVDYKILAEDAARLFGLDLYEQVSYRLVTEGEQTGVEFETVPKSWGPNILQFGLSLEDDFEGSTAFNVSSRLTRAGINSLGAEWRTDLQIGTEPFLASEFYQPLSFDSRYFVAPRVRLEQTNLTTFADNRSVARYRVAEADLGIDAGRELGRWGEARFGIFRGAGNARPQVGAPDLPKIDFQIGGAFASFGVDTLDDGQIPRHGLRADARFTMSRPGLGADTSFDTIEAALTKVWTRGRHSLQVGFDFSTTIRSDDLVQSFFPLGGFLRLSGLDRGEISGPHAGLSRLVYYRRAGETGGGVFDVPLYLGGSLEAGNVWADRSEVSLDSLIVNGSLFAGLDTWFGPLFLAAGFAEDGDTSLYLFLGAPPR